MKAKRKSRIETERKIFEAGLSVFAKYGYDDASLKQIAKKAGVNEALIIRYYKSKAKLLTNIIHTYFEEQAQSQCDLPEYETLEEEIREFFLREVRSDFKNRDFIRIVLARAGVDSKLRRDMSSRWADGANPDFLRRLKKFQEKGEISASVDLVALCYLLQIETLGLGVTVSLHANLQQELIENHLKAFATVIALGLQSGGRKNLQDGRI